MYATYTRIGPLTAARVVTLPRLPRQPAEVIRLGTPAGMTAVPTMGQPRSATALQRVARAIARLLLAI